MVQPTCTCSLVPRLYCVGKAKPEVFAHVNNIMLTSGGLGLLQNPHIIVTSSIASHARKLYYRLLA